MQTMFYRTDLRVLDDCTEPALPEDIGFLIVVYGHDYAIMETESLGSNLPQGVDPLPKCLARLLYSGRDYPPARALAMEACEDSEIDYSEMCGRLSRSLQEWFQSQPDDGFRFLRASGDQVGYMNRGQFYWVLGYVDDCVYWVSSDYQIYPDHCSEFGLTEGQLPVLFPNPWRRDRLRSS